MLSLSLFGVLGIPILTVIGIAYRRFRLSGSNEIESFSRYVLRGIKYYVGRRVRRQLAAELTLRQYARLHLRNTATEMVVPAAFPISLKVDEVFVPLLLRDARGSTIEHRDLVERPSARIVIVGEPGSGKSSLMKRTFRDACRRANADPRKSPLPLLLELGTLARLDERQLRSLTPRKLFELCCRGFDEADVYKAPNAIRDLRHGAGYLILLDGLDEVPSYGSMGVVQTIIDFGRDLSLGAPRSSLIVSTRTQHYAALHNRAFKEAFQPLGIRPFTIADVYKFLLRWPFDRERRDNITRLFSRIRELPSLTEMCRNPLALSMYVARDQQTGGDVSPETRTEFYASLLDELLVNRRFRREEETPVGRQRLRQFREQVLGTTCLGHLLDREEGSNSVPQRRLLAEIEAAGFPAHESKAVLEAMALDTGLLSVERANETYAFLHLTLCEFLAAREIVNAGPSGWHEIARRLMGSETAGRADEWASRLGEVVTFACGLAPRVLREKILADLERLDDHGLLLRAAMESQSYADGPVNDAVLSEVERLARSRPEEWDVAWFARLRQLVAVLRDASASSRAELTPAESSDMPLPADYLMRLIDTHGAEELLLATLARHDAHGAVNVAESSRDPKLMHVVASAADDFSVLLGILARCDAGEPAWKHALVHAALHESSIANVLAASGERVRATAERRWSRSFITAGSLYGELLDDVLADPSGWRPDDRGLLRRIARMNPPRRQLATMLRATLSLRRAQLRWLGLALMAFVSALLVTGFSPVSSAALILALSVIGVIVGMSATIARWLLERPEMPREIQVTIGSAAIALRDLLHEHPRSQLNRQTRTVAISEVTPLWRRPLIEEVLNLERFRFAHSDMRSPSGLRLWKPGLFEQVVSGVRPMDVAALVAARQLRDHELDDVGRHSPPKYTTDLAEA